MQGAASSVIALALALVLTAPARAGEPAATPEGSVPSPGAPPELALTWQAPAGCASTADVEAQFARLLGGPARVPSGKHVAASAIVRAPAPGRWIVDLATVLDGAVGRRSLQSDSCASVTSAAALILALMIDPSAAERADEAAQRLADAVIPPPRASSVSTAPAPPAPVEAAPPLSPFARAFVGAVFSLLPTTAPAAGVAFGASRGRFGAELSGLATEQRRATVAGSASAGGEFRLLAGGARACGVLLARVVVWQVCLGAELERLAGTGRGVATPTSKTVEMLAGTGGFVVALPLGSHAALSLDVDAAARAYHPTFDLDLGTPLYRVPFVSGFAALGLVLTI